MNASDQNKLFKIINDVVSKMDSKQLRNLTVGTYLDIRKNLQSHSS